MHKRIYSLKQASTYWENIQKMRLKFIGMIVLAMMGISVLCGCTTRYSDMPVLLPINLENHGTGRFKTSVIVDQIDYYFRGVAVGPIAVSTLVDLNDLYSTSAFGRVYSEQLMSELAMRGYDVLELRRSDAIQFLNKGGEFVLSRDTARVSRYQNVGALLVGTYLSSPERVYVNVRLIDPKSSLVTSVASVEILKTKEIAKLLRTGGVKMAMERIPVKHLANQSYPVLYVSKADLKFEDEEEDSLELIDEWKAGREKHSNNIQPKLP